MSKSVTAEVIIFGAIFLASVTSIGCIISIIAYVNSNERKHNYVREKVEIELAFQAYKRSLEPFKEWAKANANTDKELFKLLFFRVYRKTGDKGNEIGIDLETCSTRIEESISQTVDFASLLMFQNGKQMFR